ncbi:cdc42 effector protein 5-like [Arapaima gigas]
MPLHKTPRGSRLDPTMISAPLGDFRHTMHIGRGGDVFGDTSFLSTHGPSKNSVPGPVPAVDSTPPADSGVADRAAPQPRELRHSESVSSLSLDLDLDLGPSILGDVLGVMEGLGLDSKESFVSLKNEANERAESLKEKVRGPTPEENSLKLKGAGLRPKVRFSDKREEIIGREEEGEGLEQDGNESERVSSGEEERDDRNSDDGIPQGRREGESTNHTAPFPPSPASSRSSEYEGVAPSDRRTDENHLSDSDSEEASATQQGYTFEDEFEDEIGL